MAEVISEVELLEWRGYRTWL